MKDSIHSKALKYWLVLATIFSLVYSIPANAENCINAPVAGASYSIINQGGRKALDISGASSSSEANVIQWPYKKSGNQ
jgi:hypothetical protein